MTYVDIGDARIAEEAAIDVEVAGAEYVRDATCVVGELRVPNPVVQRIEAFDADASFGVVEEFATTDGHLGIIRAEVRTEVPAYQASLEVLEDFVCVLDRRRRKARHVDLVPFVSHAGASHPGAIPSDPPPA